MVGVTSLEARDTTGGAEAVGAASTEDMEAEEAGVREAAGEVSDREAPSQALSTATVRHPCKESMK